MNEPSTNGMRRDGAIAAWEIVSVTASLLIAEWGAFTILGQAKLIVAIPVALAFALVFWSHRLRSETIRDLGIRLDNFARAALWVALPTLVAGLSIVVAGWIRGSLRFDLIGSRPRYFLLPLWAFAQQYVLQGFINRRAQFVFGKGWKSVSIVALLFALLHLPNANLALLTLLGGVLWGALYQRIPNLFALALSQSVLSILLAVSLPASWLNGLRVGLKYFG